MRRFYDLFLLIVVFIALNAADATRDARRLYDDLFSSYNKLLRPVVNQSEPVQVRLGMKLSQLIEVNEVRQVVVMNVFMQLLWKDPKLIWDPKEYNGVHRLYIPSSRLWIPDIILYNNAEGDFQITEDTKAQISPDGYILWTPPAIYRYYCAMQMEFFPYDEQFCFLKFSGWSHDGQQLEVDTVSKPDINGTANDTFIYKVLLGTDLREYTPSASWDITAIPAEKHVMRYICCPDVPYPDITFYFQLRRKRLFFTTTLIVPCICISLLTVPLYYLPAGDAKVTMCITILVALTVFVLLLAELIPPSSLSIPLIGKYLLFTLCLVAVSVFATIFELNLTYSCPHTYSEMPKWGRFFVDRLPRLLLMKRSSARPGHQHRNSKTGSWSSASAQSAASSASNNNNAAAAVVAPQPQILSTATNNQYTYNRSLNQKPTPLISLKPASFDYDDNDDDDYNNNYLNASPLIMSLMASNNNQPHQQAQNHHFRFDDPSALLSSSDGHVNEIVRKVCSNVKSIRDNFFQRQLVDAYKREWKFVGMVIDRILLWIFAVIAIGGTLLIILWAPALYDTSPALPRSCRGVVVNNTDDIPYDCVKRHVTVCIQNKCYNEMSADMVRQLDEAEGN